MAFNIKSKGNGKKGANTGKPAKKYIYIAVEKESRLPILDKEGNYIVSNVTENENIPEWGDKLDKLKISKNKILISNDVRQEVIKREGEEKLDAKRRTTEELVNRFMSEIEKARAAINPDGKESNSFENSTESTLVKEEQIVVATIAEGEKDDNRHEESAIVNDENPLEAEKKEQSIVEENKDTESLVEEKNEKKANGGKKEKKAPKKGEESLEDIDVIIDTVISTSQGVEQRIDELEKGTRNIVKPLINMDSFLRSMEKDLGNTIYDQAGKILDGQKKLSTATDKNGKMISEIAETTEMFQGQFKKLDQIDALAQILSDKGLEIKKTAAPTSREEEDIVNMSKYATAIIDQLTIAACELVKKQAEYDKQDGYKANSEQEINAQIKEASAIASKKAKLELVEAILNKFTDIESMVNKENQMLSLVWSALTEQGVEVDGNGAFMKGEIIDIGAEDAEKLAAKYAGINGAGKYTVTKTGLSFLGETVFKAEFEKMAE